MSEEKEILLGYLIGSISILRDIHIQFTEKSRNKLADKIMELLIAYEKEKEERERIGKLYYEANENCIKYEKIIEKQSKEIEELKDINKKLEARKYMSRR